MGLQPCIWCTGRMMQLPSCATAATQTQATHTAQQNRGGATPAAPPAKSPWLPTRGCTSAAGVTPVIQREQGSALRGQALLLLLGLLSGCAAARGTPAPAGKQVAGGGWSSCCRPAPAMKQVAARVGLLPPAPHHIQGLLHATRGLCAAWRCCCPSGAACVRALHPARQVARPATVLAWQLALQHTARGAAEDVDGAARKHSSATRPDFANTQATKPHSICSTQLLGIMPCKGHAQRIVHAAGCCVHQRQCSGTHACTCVSSSPTPTLPLQTGQWLLPSWPRKRVSPTIMAPA